MNPNRARKRIQLLIGSAAVLIALFLAIATPGCYFPVLSSVSRVKADMKSTATALESYFVEHQSYPSARPLRELWPGHLGDLKKAGGADLEGIEPGTGPIIGLTTPVAYLADLFMEPPYPHPDSWASSRPVRWFNDVTGATERNSSPLAYYNDRNLGWIIWARGPDGVYDIQNPELVYNATSEPVPSAELIDLTYDPTNGSRSKGDIYRLKQ